MNRQKGWVWALFVLVILATTAEAEWQYLPVGTPLVYSIAADSAGQKLWLSAGPGGIWRSLDGGATWEPQAELSRIYGSNDGIVTPVSPDGDTLVLTGWNQPLRHSANGGETWADILGPFSAAYEPQFFVWPMNRQVWLYNWRQQVHRSLNAGENWATVIASFQGYPQLYASWAGDSTIWGLSYDVSSVASCRLYRSRDAGSTWSSSYLSFMTGWEFFNDLAVLRDGRMIICRQMAYMDRLPPMISSDSGQTWQPWVVFTDPDALPYSLDEDAAVAGQLYAAGNFPGGFLRSTDNGATWAANDDLPPEVVDGRLTIEPFSGTLYLRLGYAGLYRSTDRGEHWQAIGLPPIGEGTANTTMAVTHDALYYERGPSLLASQQYLSGQHRRLESGSAEWQPAPLWSLHENAGYGVSPMIRDEGDTLVYFATNWAPLEPPSYRLESVDDGVSWALIPLPLAISWYNLWTTRDGTGQRLAATLLQDGFERDSLALSADGGVNWQTTTVPWPAYNFVSEVQWSASALYAATTEGGGSPITIYRTADDGATWQTLGDTPLASAFTVLDDSVFALQGVTEESCQCRCWTGSEWQDRGVLPNLGDPEYARCLLALDTEPGILIATRIYLPTILLSDDHGWTWRTLETALPYAEQQPILWELTYDAPRGRLWASTGVGTAYLDVSEIAHSSGPLTWKPADYTVLSCYPNPFNSSARIRYDLLQAGRVELTLYDLQGRLVKTLVDATANAGAHEILIDGNGLASGTYFVKLHTPALTRTEKLLLLK